MVDALYSLAGRRQAKAAQSCSLKAVADAVAHAGPPPRGIGWPRSPIEASGCSDTPVHLAPLDVGAVNGSPRRS